MSWPRERYHRRSRPSASTASSTGTAAFSPIRRPRSSSTTTHAMTRWSSLSTCGIRLALNQPTSGRSCTDRRTFSIRAGSRATSPAKELQKLSHIIEELSEYVTDADQQREIVKEMMTYGCPTRMHVVRLLAPTPTTRTRPRTSTSAPRAFGRVGKLVANARLAIASAPWRGTFGPLEGVILHEPPFEVATGPDPAAFGTGGAAERQPSPTTRTFQTAQPQSRSPFRIATVVADIAITPFSHEFVSAWCWAAAISSLRSPRAWPYGRTVSQVCAAETCCTALAASAQDSPKGQDAQFGIQSWTDAIEPKAVASAKIRDWHDALQRFQQRRLRHVMRGKHRTADRPLPPCSGTGPSR